MKRMICISVFGLMMVSKSILAADLSDWAKYADSLQNCTPGSFNLADPVTPNVVGVSPFTMYEITGMNSGNCQLKITKSFTQPGQSKPMSLMLSCAIPSEKLAVVSKSAKDISGGGTVSANDEAATIMKSSCKQAQ